MRRSVEVDVVIGRDAGAVEEARHRFCIGRGIPPDHPLLDTALVGEPGAVLRRIAEYKAAGVTDLMCAFADFPGFEMLTVFMWGSYYGHVLWSTFGCAARRPSG